MVQVISLDLDDYGLRYSMDAWAKRTTENIPGKRNIATFHFVPRPGGAPPNAVDPTETIASTGIGVYTTVGFYVQRNVRINASHSEQQFIENKLQALIEAKVFPQQYVIDWVYTERPACPDVWNGKSIVAKGCRTQIEKIEQLQKQTGWDLQPTNTPYALRNDLNITIYSTFESASEIDEAAVFAPIRSKVVNDLYDDLIELYEAYPEEEEEDYDLDSGEYGSLAAYASELAEGLPSWADYTFTVKQRAEFLNELTQEAAKIYSEEKGRFNTATSRLRRMAVSRDPMVLDTNGALERTSRILQQNALRNNGRVT